MSLELCLVIGVALDRHCRSVLSLGYVLLLWLYLNASICQNSVSHAEISHGTWGRESIAGEGVQVRGSQRRTRKRISIISRVVGRRVCKPALCGACSVIRQAVVLFNSVSRAKTRANTTERHTLKTKTMTRRMWMRGRILVAMMMRMMIV